MWLCRDGFTGPLRGCGTGYGDGGSYKGVRADSSQLPHRPSVSISLTLDHAWAGSLDLTQ